MNSKSNNSGDNNENYGRKIDCENREKNHKNGYNRENGNRYWKVNTKTAKKKIDKLVNKKFEYHRDIYFDAQEHVWGWEAKNQDIIKRR